MIRQGTAPGPDLLCASRLISLEKPDGGIRPIAIGDLIYRVATKAILTTSFQASMLLPNQLGVQSPGGVEPAIFLLQEAIAGQNKAGFQRLASIDLANAFNSVSRTAIAAAIATYAPAFYKTATWAYNSPSLLVTEEGTILASSEGVRQGDPLSPLFFSLAFRPTLERLITQLPHATIIAYLDDLFILERKPRTAAAARPPLLTQARKVFQKSPFLLNQTKSKEWNLATLKTEGLAVLGSYIGPLEKRKEFLQAKIESLRLAIKTIQDLPKQYTLLLLRGSTQQLLRHLQRQLDPIELQDS